MPTTPTYPGVYIEEIPSGVRTIIGVATSITAFIGIASRGPTNEPVRIQSFGDFERQFGGLWVKSAMSYAVQQYFLNGGTDALIIRVVPSDAAKAKLASPIGWLNLEAASEGKWVDGLIAEVDHQTRKPADTKLFNLTILEPAAEEEDPPIVLESFRNVSVDPDSARFVTTVLEQQSNLVRIDGRIPENSERPPIANDPDNPIKFAGGLDGTEANISYEQQYEGSPGDKTGIYALEKADLFNLLCIPPRVRGSAVADDNAGKDLLAKALKYCKKRRAMLIVDPPTAWIDPSRVKASAEDGGVDSLGLRDENAIIYYPNVKLSDPNKENRLQEFPPCGVVAGIFARTDAQRGVWKAPAGIEATLSGVRELAYKMTDGENGQLNPIGVNCLRTFRVYGNIVWGARTLEGADQLASEWKYVPVRRLALFLQESLYRGTQWVVFEPNDEPLWAQIRLNIGAFMNNLFRQGAFQGSSPKDAYFVKCDKETTTQNDINRGIVNIIVGYAPLKPAEFVIIKFQQIAGNIAT
ncbi:MAG: phage tail sheath subtilisin-like domain-containing protein [Nostocaceae cyanobacterium]|nr:phage tail sheath subtilisin-like domain-containing protein [Nostocaceae cyanobacterium]